METLDDEWELAPENAHDNARRLMTADWLWDIADDGSPFGNDTGWDTLEFYRAWIEESDEDEEFLDALFEEWEVDRDLAEGIDDEELLEELEDVEFDVLTYDDVVIAAAFAQLVLEGEPSRAMASMAMRALRREALPAVIEFRDWDDPEERRARCEEMLAIMEAAV
jgi:uncharacterized protein YfeS